jgi:NADP-dependent 3-hydroxy acid dehydrogenase YdfG
VTGGGSGIGLAIAKFYAQARAHHVIITGRTVNALETTRREIPGESPETEVTTIATDVGSKHSITALWKRVAAEIGKVDVLVNSAGIGGAHHKIGEGDVDEWWTVQVSFHVLAKLLKIADLTRKLIFVVLI